MLFTNKGFCFTSLFEKRSSIWCSWVNEKWIVQKMNLLLELYITEIEQFLLIHKKDKTELSMTEWPGRVCLQKKNGMNHKQGSLGGFVTDFYAPVWVMGNRVFYHQTITFTGENGDYQPWTRCPLKSKRVLEMHFLGISRPKCWNFPLHCPSWGYLRRYWLSKQ